MLTCLPAWLLRKRLLPASTAAWLRQLPLPPRLRWQADVAVAGLLMLPLGLAYAVSASIWLLQSPTWLRPVAAPGIAATIAVWLLAWLLTTLIVAQRLRAPRPAQRARPPTMTHLRAATAPLAHRVPVAPAVLAAVLAQRECDRPPAKRAAGHALAPACWPGCCARHCVPAPLLGLLASASLVIVTDRGDKAVREQIAVLRPTLNAWPLASAALTRLACAASLLPPFAVLLAGAVLLYAIDPAALQQRVSRVYALTASAALLAIVGLPRLTARGRVALVVLSILALSAIGSELWN